MSLDNSENQPNPIPPSAVPEVSPKETKRTGKASLVFGSIAILASSVTALVVGSNNGNQAVARALSDYTVNDSSSTTVYQQIVTNGWVAKDLLTVIAHQNATLIMLASAGVGVLGIIGIAVLFAIHGRK
jgi:hypothetical protein